MSGAAVTPSWLSVFGNDLFSFLLCILLLVGYHLFMVYKVSKDPTYTVRKGDTLAAISGRYNVAMNDLRRWNQIKGYHLQTGAKLVIKS